MYLDADSLFRAMALHLFSLTEGGLREESVLRTGILADTGKQDKAKPSTVTVDIVITDLCETVEIKSYEPIEIQSLGANVKKCKIYDLKELWSDLARGRQYWINFELPGRYTFQSIIRGKSLTSGGSLAGLVRVTTTQRTSEGLSEPIEGWVYKFDDKEKLIDEISWIKGLSQRLKQFFPEILEERTRQKPYFYKMPYYKDFKDVRTLIFNGEWSYNKLSSAVDQILEFMFENIYSRSPIRTDPDFLNEIHLDRIQKRFDQCEQDSPIFRDIVNRKPVVNGVECLNPKTVLQALNKHYTKATTYLNPPERRDIHGDLHFGNILVKEEGGKLSFKFIDPRGFSRGCDYCYDFAKIRHSIDGHDCLKAGDGNQFYRLKVPYPDCVSENVVEIEYEIPAIDAPLRAKEACSMLKRLDSELDNKISKYLRDDPYWRLRTRFCEAVHFLSLWPFFRGELDKQMIFYGIGVHLLSEFAYSQDWLL